VLQVEDDEVGSHACLGKLLDFISTNRRIEKVENCLCEGAFDNNSMDCINGECKACGFKKLWSEGLRQVVAKKGAAEGDVHPG
jgi:hypothetical protein